MTDHTSYELQFELAHQVHLQALVFSMKEVTLIFSHRYRRARDQALLLNDLRLVAGYTNAKLGVQRWAVEYPVTLSMHVIIPELLGREFLYGLDISPGAKTYLEFKYLLEGVELESWLVLDEVQQGARKPIKWPRGSGLVRSDPIKFPFPVDDRIPCVGGRFSFPFRTNEETSEMINLPLSIERRIGA